jgi:hypothetical protein
MRWDNLFDDLESQLEHELGAEETDLQAEEERLRLGRLSMRDRLVALRAESAAVRVTLSGGRALAVRPLVFGRDWLSGDVVDDSARRAQVILPLTAIATVQLDRQQVERSLVAPAGSEPALSDRLGLAFVLRDLCRRRRALELELSSGVLHGTIDRVGRDHLDLAVHEPGTARREAAVGQYRVVAFAQLLLVRL